MKLTETFQFKLSREMREAVDAEAERLRVRPVDVVRMAIAEKVTRTVCTCDRKDHKPHNGDRNQDSKLEV